MSINICPVCRYHNVLVVPHSIQVGEPQVCAQPCGCIQPSSAIPTGSISGWKVLMYMCCGTLCSCWIQFWEGWLRTCYKGLAGWLDSLARTLPIIQGRGNVNRSVHCFSWFWIVPSAKGSLFDFLSHFPTLGYLSPEKRGRGILTLNIQIDFTLGLAHSFINTGGYLMPPWIQKSWDNFFFFLSYQILLFYQTEEYKIPSSFS